VTRFLRAAVCLATLFAGVADALAQAPIAYALSFPDRDHRLMDVDMTLGDLPAMPLQLLMSRASPGRYALHDFAKNVFDLRVMDAEGRSLAVAHVNPHEWDVAQHGPQVRVHYRIFGDRIDGTYLAVDATHAHINMPSALMWVRGLEQRPATVHFEPPPGSGWRVATQLMPGTDAFTFTAPSLQYLMDSPSEFSAFSLRTFPVADGGRTPTFRLAVHHTGTDAELDSLTRDVERMVREARNVFGEFPAYEGNTYTFIADWLPWASGDGMEHRNSTIITSTSSIRGNRADLLDAMSHEFFHSWNVERIRPKSLEPFNFEDQNMSGELWLAEGFTNYYGPLVLERAGLTTLEDFAFAMGSAINTVLNSPARQFRTAEEISQMAPFVDAATSIDRTDFENTYISYYTWGSAIALGLDLSLREQTDQRVTLDDFMRALWRKYGKPGGLIPGYVDHPYTIDDVRRTLGEVAGNTAFADDFFRHYIEGHEVVDYERLLDRAGLVLRRTDASRPWIGVRFQDAQGARIAAAAPFGSPAYRAGLDRDDVIVALGNATVPDSATLTRVLGAYRPGQQVSVTFDRRGQRATTLMTVGSDPHVDVVPVEAIGRQLADAQRRFREAWLSSAARNTF
jgi:predicted metalloprotease with PDZ domain